MNLFNKKQKRLARNEVIVFNTRGKETSKEAYVRLKDNILYYGVDGIKKVIQIESSISGEAKTSTLANLAVCLGESGKKVCVVDLDTRKPRLHRVFNVENNEGITDYMIDDSITKDQLYKQTDYSNVTIINRGSEVQNASLILTSDKMKKLFEELREEFDFILVDCPPVLIISDYIHISKLTDGVLFVVAYGQTKKKQVSDSILLLKKNNIEIIGSVFTFFNPKRANNASEYTYYNYYGYEDKKRS